MTEEGTDAGADADAAPSVDAWEFVRRTQAGDAEAFGELYDRYVDLVYRFIFYRLGDRAQAEDLTSETFLRALRRISSVSEQGRDIGAWLVTIARNLVLDHVKSAHYRLSMSTDDFFERQTDGTTESEVLATLDQEALVEAIRQLSPEQQEAIVLRFFQGLNLAETAEIMGRNAGAVKALQHRGLKRLQVLLDAPPAGTSTNTAPVTTKAKPPPGAHRAKSPPLTP